MQTAALQNIASGDEASQRLLHKTIAHIQGAWAFTNAEMADFLHTKPNTYGYWLQKERIPLGKSLSPEMELVVALMAIYRSLGAMFVSAKDQVLWLRTPHPDFAHQSPLDFAKSSAENFFYLRSYLDYIRGRGA